MQFVFHTVCFLAILDVHDPQLDIYMLKMVVYIMLPMQVQSDMRKLMTHEGEASTIPWSKEYFHKGLQFQLYTVFQDTS